MNNTRNTQLPNSEISAIERAAFFKMTYMHLALAILIFMLVEIVFLNTPMIVGIGVAMTQGWTWLIVLGLFMFVTSIAEKWAAKSVDPKMQYAGFGLYIVAEAFIFVPLLTIAMTVSGDGSLLTKALILTVSLFSGLTAVVFLSGKDFSFLRTALIVGSLVAGGLIIAGMLFGFDLGLAFIGAMILLASGSILYQTSNLIHRYDTSQYVAASLGLFASFMLLLWYIISFFLNRD